MWKSGIFGVACAAIIFGACSSNNGADGTGNVGASAGIGGGGYLGQGGVGLNLGGAGLNLGGNGYVGGAGQNLGGAGQNLGGAGYLGGAGNVGGGGSLGGTGGALTTGVVRTCAACDNTCCQPDDCGVIGFAGCSGALVDCLFNSCAQNVCGTGLNGNPGVANKCPGTCAVTKTLADCQAAGKNCDSIPDGCGGLFSCGTCTAPDTCGGGGIAFQCGNDASTACANFCPLVPTTCASGTDTVLHGTVWSPAGNPAIDPARGEVPLPIPNAMIYVPNGSTTAPYGLSKFTDGVAQGCDCNVQGPPLNIFPSGVDGSFTVTGVPAGVDIPLVIQLGKWRRVITIPAAQAPACAGRVELTAAQTRLPRREAEQNAMDAIPLMALSTGQVDALECVLRKMGVEDTQFSNGEDSGNGRIRFYRQMNPSTSGSNSGGPGASCRAGGGSCVGNTPALSTLVANQASVDRYDALLFPCKGGAHDESTAAKNLVLDNAANTAAYVNKGGRAIFTHFSYAWLYNQPPAIALPWPSTTVSANVNTQWDTAYGQIDTSFPRGATFQSWLGLPNVNALTAVTPFPYITVTEVRRDLANPTTWPYYPAGNLLYAQRWIFHGTFRTPPDNAATTGSNHVPDSIQHVTFDTPYGDPATTLQCGRVLYSSFHVTSAGLSNNSCIQGTAPNAIDTNCFFPAECGTTMENQEKVLAYMLFDMTATVCPTTKTCVPIDCASQGISCGQASDGCGHELYCGPCTGCLKISCEQSCINQGSVCSTTAPAGDPNYYMCPQPDGCGATATCYCKIG
jgi:hypothetical protein